MDIIYTTFLFLLRDGWRKKIKTLKIPTNFLHNNNDNNNNSNDDDVGRWSPERTRLIASKLHKKDEEEEKEIVKKYVFVEFG